MMKYECYDPRISENVETDNPALVFAMFQNHFCSHIPIAWDVVARLADYCDAPIESPSLDIPIRFESILPDGISGELVKGEDGKYEIKPDRLAAIQPREEKPNADA